MDPEKRKANANKERRLEDELAAIQTSYSALETPEPPELLDLAVLNTARREIAKKKRKSLRWIGSFATASVLVLALTIVVQQNRELLEPGRSNESKLDSAGKKESAAGTGAFAPAQTDRLTTGSEEAARESSVMMKQSAAKREDAPQSPPPTQAASVIAELEAEPESNLGASSAYEKMSADADFRTEASEKSKAMAEPIAEQADKGRERQAELRQPSPAPEETNAGARDEEDFSDAVSPTKVQLLDDNENAQGLAAPDKWISKMLMMLESEQFDQLEEQLAAFRSSYPDYPLPPELEKQ